MHRTFTLFINGILVLFKKIDFIFYRLKEMPLFHILSWVFHVILALPGHIKLKWPPKLE